MNQSRQIGRSVPRLEDPPLLRGAARFVDDIKRAGTLEAAFVRSPHAHARIRSIDLSAARAAPGVAGVFAFADLRPHLMQERLPMQFRSSALPPDCTPYPLAKDEVAFVGDPVALVVARSRYVAEDAAALVAVEYEELPAISDCRRAAEPDAPCAHHFRTSNVLTEIRQSYGDVEAGFRQAAHRVKPELKQHRGGAHPIEGRGVLASYDPGDDRLTVWSSTQLAHEVRAFLVQVLGLDENQVWVVTPEVGGGFGSKFLLYPEEVVVALASRLLRAPVKWIEDRREHFLAAIQERDQYWEIEAAADKDGRLLAARGRMINDQGAYTPQGVNLSYNAATAFPGPYKLPAYDLRVLVVETNKVAAAPVRGAGYPEGAFAMERTLDRIADTVGIDRVEIRRRNLVPPEQIPYVTPLKSRSGSAIAYDSGDFPAIMQTALDAIGFAGFAERQRAARAQGRFRGLGVANGLKGTGRGPFESALVRIGRSGRVSLYTGAMPMGQGIKTALAQICAEPLGIDPAQVTVIAGDTATIPLGMGGFASRQTVTAGSSTHLAARSVREKALAVAAHLLEAGVDDLDMRDGRIEVRGVPGHGVSLQQVASALSGDPGYAIPGKFEPGLESFQNWMPETLTYGMSSHAVELEVDADTAQVRLLNYVVANDCGRAINPMIVEGQILGGAAHGVGNALFEWMGYDENAQPITANFGEYLLATAPEMPRFTVRLLEYAATTNPLGVKGVGEAGCVPAAAAVIAAIESALAPFGVVIEEAPILPARLFALLKRHARIA